MATLPTASIGQYATSRMEIANNLFIVEAIPNTNCSWLFIAFDRCAMAIKYMCTM